MLNSVKENILQCKDRIKRVIDIFSLLKFLCCVFFIMFDEYIYETIIVHVSYFLIAEECFYLQRNDILKATDQNKTLLLKKYNSKDYMISYMIFMGDLHDIYKTICEDFFVD